MSKGGSTSNAASSATSEQAKANTGGSHTAGTTGTHEALRTVLGLWQPWLDAVRAFSSESAGLQRAWVDGISSAIDEGHRQVKGTLTRLDGLTEAMRKEWTGQMSKAESWINVAER